MAANRFTYTSATITPDSNPDTLAQFVAPTNQRTLIRAIEVQPQGSSGATAPLLFDLVDQTTAGGLVADNTFKKHAPEGSETVQTAANRWNAGAAEPTLAAGQPVRASFSIHQQGSRRWVPESPIVIPGGGRIGIRFLSTAVAVKLSVELEE